MPSTQLPKPIATYMAAANAQDIGVLTTCFDTDAVVRDEGQDRRGVTAIREWAVAVSKKYRPMLEVKDVVDIDGKTILTGRVSGNFPGSPIELRYLFTLHDDKIARLEIG